MGTVYSDDAESRAVPPQSPPLAKNARSLPPAAIRYNVSQKAGPEGVRSKACSRNTLLRIGSSRLPSVSWHPRCCSVR